MQSLHAWELCVLSGNLIDSNYILDRHSGGQWPELSEKKITVLLSEINNFASSSLDTLISPTDICFWVEGSLIPGLQSQQRNYKRGGSVAFEICCEFLRTQAVSYELAFQVPFEPIMLTELAVSVANSHCPEYLNKVPRSNTFSIYDSDIGDDKKTALLPLGKLHDALELQVSVWRAWEDRPTCAEVIDLQIDGLIRDKLLSIVSDIDVPVDSDSDCDDESINKICKNITCIIRPLASTFCCVLDAIIVDWLQSVIGSAIIAYSHGQMRAAISSHNSALVLLYSHLIAVASTIENPDLLASAVLALWQISASSSSAPVSEPKDEGVEIAQAKALDRLSQIGSDIYPRVCAGREKDALQESIRLLRLKSIASTYGVSNFDVRSTRQLRNVVSIIASAYWEPKSIEDAIEFAEGWNSINVDLPYILGRALIYRVFVRSPAPTASDEKLPELEMPPMEALAKKKLLEQSFLSIPEHKRALVTETVITFLLHRLEDICEAMEENGDLNTEELNVLKEEFAMTCSGAITIGGMQLEAGNLSKTSGDLRRDGAKFGTTASERNSRISNANDEEILNANMLLSLKRIRFLQSDYNIYLSVTRLKNTVFCRQMAQKIAEKRASDLIAREKDENTSGSEKTLCPNNSIKNLSSARPSGRLLSPCPMMSSKTRHACLLMDISPVYVEYCVIAALIHQGKMVHEYETSL